MSGESLFVGAVAIALGVLFLAGTLARWDWWRDLAKVQWLEERLGERGAGIVFVLLGTALVAVGLALVAGYL